jgi:DNA-binding GntR family transcriptional regulator
VAPDTAKPTSRVRHVDPTSVVDQVAYELRRSIVRGSLAPGSSFSLREISRQLGVSFIPLREAMRRLEAQGLIQTRPGRSAEVTPLDREDLHAIYRLRKLIEPEITGRASALLTPSVVGELNDLLVLYADTVSDVDRRWELHRQFHRELLRPAASTWDLRALEMLWDAGERYVRHAFDKRVTEPEVPEKRAEIHRVLLEVVSSGDAELASAAALEHLSHNEEIAIRGIEDVSVG